MSVASSVILRRQASRSTLRFSFSNSSGVIAGPFALLFLAAGFELDGANACAVGAFLLKSGWVAICGFVQTEGVDAVGGISEEDKEADGSGQT